MYKIHQDQFVLTKEQLHSDVKNNYVIPSSKMAKNTVSLIRRMVDNLKVKPNPTKSFIPLSIGDPTVFGNLKCADVVKEAVINAVRSKKYNGYAPSVGYEESRSAIAKYCSCPNYTLTCDDIIITSGCSGALEHCILVLANPGQNILIPRPGFSAYNTLCESVGIKIKYYNLIPEKNWEIDIHHLESVIDNDTAAIIINNPSNPCGSVYSRNHLMGVMNVIEKCGLPIIADEIYHYFTFNGPEFEYMASLNTNVSILSCNGLTKRFLIPGWRFGWIAIYDHSNRFTEIREGLTNLATRTLGANTFVQGAVKEILSNVPIEHFRLTLKIVKTNFEIAQIILEKIPGLQLIKSYGAMYAMVKVMIDKFPNFKNNEHFISNMISEESVFCLPSEVFGIANYFRIVLTVPADIMKEACERIGCYCRRHFQNQVVE